MYDNIPLLNNEMYTLDYFLQDDVCRFCWNKGAKFIIMNENDDKALNLENNLLNKIRECLDITLIVKGPPDKLCQTCLDNVLNFHSFKYFCKETDRRLRDIFSNEDCKSSSKTDDDAYLVKIEKSDGDNTSSVYSKTEYLEEFLDECQSDDDELPLKQLSDKTKHSKSKLDKNETVKKKNSTNFCNICILDFETKELFNSHNAESHGIENGYYKCFGCEKRFKTRRGRVGHETHFCKNLQKGYKCEKCEKLLPSRGSYEKHMKNHRSNTSGQIPEAIVKCRKCLETFKTREALLKHKQLHNGGKKNYVCESCGKVFNRMDYLYKHKLTHSGTKLHVCPHCGFRTTQKSSLTVHIRKHTGERPYSCDLCPQKCVSSSNLKAHRRRHLGVKKFECTICSKKFGYKMSLDEHFAATHDRSQTHVCNLCGASYSRQRGLKRHMQAKHGKEKKSEEEKTVEQRVEENTEVQEIETFYKIDEFYVKVRVC